MSQPIMITVNWYGPYEYDEVTQEEWGNGLYLFHGKKKHQKSNSTILYCGITEQTFAQRFNRHHKLGEINRDLHIWRGHVTYPTDIDSATLKLAESILIYWWQPELNEKSKFNPPKHQITLVNKWYKKNEEPRINQHSDIKDIPDVLSFDGEYWRTGNIKVYAE